ANGTWNTSGTFDGTDSGGSDSSYSGNGSYTVNIGDPSSSWTTGSGTITDSGNDHWTYNYDARYSLDNAGWHVLGGSGTVNGTGSTDWSYTANGSYGHPLDGGTLTGTWSANGEDHTTTDRDLSKSLGSNGVWTTTGTTDHGHTAE